jgi:hypothetical protein
LFKFMGYEQFLDTVQSAVKLTLTMSTYMYLGIPMNVLISMY